MAYVINPDLCMACGTCQGECPTGAINEGDVYSISSTPRAEISRFSSSFSATFLRLSL